MAKNKKESTTSVGVIPPLTDYADGISSFYLAPHFGRNYPVRRDGDMISVSIEDDAFVYAEDEDDETNPRDPENPKDTEKPSLGRKAPTLMDIELVSSQVVYDASNNPTSKVTFKIRNSSGEAVKAVNVLVEKK
jgi:hypothetical protein